MGHGFQVTCGGPIDVDPDSDIGCGAPILDVSVLSATYDLNPASSLPPVIYGDTVTPPNPAYWDVAIGCWNLSNPSLPPPLWTHRIGTSSDVPGSGTTRKMYEAFTDAVVVQTVTRTQQDLIWPATDSSFTLAAPTPINIHNVYVWGRFKMGGGATIWTHHYQTNAEYDSIFISLPSGSECLQRFDII